MRMKMKNKKMKCKILEWEQIFELLIFYKNSTAFFFSFFICYLSFQLSQQVAATESKNADSKEINQQRKKRGWRRFIYLEPVLFFYSIGDFMNYTIQQQYVYYRVGEDFGLPVEYMMNASGGCTSTQNSTNSTLWDLERKVKYILILIL